jgi:hypothetical protein
MREMVICTEQTSLQIENASMIPAMLSHPIATNPTPSHAVKTGAVRDESRARLDASHRGSVEKPTRPVCSISQQPRQAGKGKEEKAKTPVLPQEGFVLIFCSHLPSSTLG